MSQSPFKTVLNELEFTEQEQAVFTEIIKYAMTCQKTGQDDNLKAIINNKIEEMIDNEISKN